MSNVYELRPTKKLKVNGVSRDVEHDRVIAIYFNRPLTDAELVFFHEVCERSAPLMDGVK